MFNFLFVSLLLLSRFTFTSGCIDLDEERYAPGGFRRRKLYDYSGAGPDKWPDISPACAYHHQSPIDIPAQSSFTYGFTGVVPGFSLDYTNLPENTNAEVEFENLENTVEAVFNGQNISVKSAGLDALAYIVGRSEGIEEQGYTLQQLHFHWGLEDRKGSEHMVNGNAYSAEMHLVHFNSKYGNLSSSVGHDDGLLVIGVFLEISESPEDDDLFKSIVEALDSEEFNSTKTVALEGFSLGPIADALATSKFYLYPGSLTTPGCNEIVTWVVMKEPLTISEDTIGAFRQTQRPNGDLVAPNYRPVQNGNGRWIFDAEIQRYAKLATSDDSDDGGDDNGRADHRERRKKGIVVAVDVPIVCLAVLALAIGFMAFRAKKEAAKSDTIGK